MYTLIQKCNEDSRFPIENIDKAIAQATSERAIIINKLYDLCFLSEVKESLTEDDRIEIESYFAMFPDYRLLVGESGILDFSQESVDYACLRSMDTEFKDNIRLYARYLELSDNLDNLQQLRARQKNGIVTLNKRFHISSEGKLASSQAVCLVKESLYDITQELQSLHIGRSMIHALVRKIGVSEWDYRAHLFLGLPFFTTELSQLEESEFVEKVLTGRVKLDGKFGALLDEHMKAYYEESFAAFNTTKKFVDYKGFMYRHMADYVKMDFPELYETDKKIVFMSEFCVYYLTEVEEEALKSA